MALGDVKNIGGAEFVEVEGGLACLMDDGNYVLVIASKSVYELPMLLASPEPRDQWMERLLARIRW